ncbi:PREDICTED: uncharacterized protein LOC104814624 [Tarenaya hassleriana]|uniref:uncharacterized protein LOC104814624 n=1 Tax=Tarenaya hassleriana TaxID=28532 RepID=UPI00053C8C85|nr:PREDICTED: uncharacterized protein LOC104814624 [Tarenaya hassleriana]
MGTLWHNCHFAPPVPLDSKVFPFRRFSFVKVRFSTRIDPILCSRAKSLKMATSERSPAVEQQRVVISNSHDEKIVGLLHETGSREIVILCHGFRANKNHRIMTNVAAALENEGLTAFRFDFSGNGESQGNFQYGHYYREADDLRSVIQHFSNMNRVVTAILGHSKGGDVVLLYASKYHDIPNVVNVSGRYDLKRGIGERIGEDFLERIKQNGFINVKDKNGNSGYRVTEESLMDRLNTNMQEACLKIDRECRVLTVHGSVDEIIPVEDAMEFDKIIPNHKLHIVEGADHGYSNHQSELISLVLDFIKAGIAKI